MAANHRHDYILNPSNAELNPICHLLALLGGATIVVVSRLRVNKAQNVQYADFECRYSSQVPGLNERSLLPEAATLCIINRFVWLSPLYIMLTCFSVPWVGSNLERLTNDRS